MCQERERVIISINYNVARADSVARCIRLVSAHACDFIQSAQSVGRPRGFPVAAASRCCRELSSRLWHPRLAAALSLLAGTVQQSPSWAHGRRRPARRWRASAQTAWRSCGWWICPQTVQTHLYVLHEVDGVVESLSVVSFCLCCCGFSFSRTRGSASGRFFFLRVCWRVAWSLRWPPGHPLMTLV